MSRNNVRILGFLAALGTVFIWAAFLLGTRYAVSGRFTVEEVVFLRLAPAAILLVPFMLKLGVTLRGQSILGTFMLTIGASAVFPYVVSSGLAFAPASDAGILAPGTLPFWAMLAAFVIMGEKPSKQRSLGLFIILIGASFVGLWDVISGESKTAWKGHLMFVAGAAFWAVYSAYFRISGLSPLHALVIGVFWGTCAALPVLLLSGRVTFANASWSDIAAMGVLQGFFIAVLASLLFSYAVRALGAAQTSGFGALTPVLVLIGGALFLGEEITVLKSAGVICVTIGVVLASGLYEQRFQKTSAQ